MKRSLLITIIYLLTVHLNGQYIEKLGKGPEIRTFYHQQGINYYLSCNDGKGKVFSVYYDTVTSAFNFGKEYCQVRLQIYDGISWLFTKPVKLYSLHSIDAPRVLDIKFLGSEIFICGSFDSSQNNLGAGIIKYDGGWGSCGSLLLQTFPDYFEVNKCHVYGKHLLITGNFDSIPGKRVNGLLEYDGTKWNPVGNSDPYGFKKTSDRSNVFFRECGDSLYAFRKFKIGYDSIHLGDDHFNKVAVWRNGKFVQQNSPSEFITSVQSYKDRMLIIPASGIGYFDSIYWYNGTSWKSFPLGVSYYTTNLVGSFSNGNLFYMLLLNTSGADPMTLNTYVFDGLSVKSIISFKVADIYLPLEFGNDSNNIYLGGNFNHVQTQSFMDSCRNLLKLAFETKTIVTGVSFIDLNGDGIKQGGEAVLPFSRIYDKNSNHLTTSDGSGRYNLRLPTAATYELVSINDKGYTCSKIFNIPLAVDTLLTSDFGFTSEKKNDLSINLTCHSGNKAKQGFLTHYTAELTNYSDLDQNVIVNIRHHNKIIQRSYTGFIPISSNSNGFSVSRFVKAHEQLHFSFAWVYAVDSFILGEQTITSASLNITDIDFGNNSDTVQQTVVAAFDPNIKMAYPDVVANLDKEIKYTIFFQNLGNDTALNVTVVDSIGSLFNISSVTFRSTSHGYHKPELIDNCLVWTFNRINLPPKKTDSTNSVGFVSLTTRLNKNAKLGDTIYNKAAIFFDYQKPVITNNAKVVYRKTDIEEISSESGFSFYPNPGKGTIFYKNEKVYKGNLEFYSVDGKLVYNVEIGTEGTIELPGNLHSGIYIMKFSGLNMKLGKLILTE